MSEGPPGWVLLLFFFSFFFFFFLASPVKCHRSFRQPIQGCCCFERWCPVLTLCGQRHYFPYAVKKRRLMVAGQWFTMVLGQWDSRFLG
jgi:hypothetical protein